MGNLGSEASLNAMYFDLMDKPYRQNARFGAMALSMIKFGDEVKRFREMTPSAASDDLFEKSWRLRVHLKDMIADGGDYLSQSEIRDSIMNVSSLRRNICTRMIAPKGGF